MNCSPNQARTRGLLVLLLAAAACGRGEPAEPGPRRVVFDDVGDTTTHIDSATGIRLTSPEARPQEFTPIELPSGFPSLPSPAGALVIDARVDRLPSGGSYSSASLVVERDTRQVYDWYREALRQEGWRIVDQSQLDQVHKLRATKLGETLDLAVQVHPDYPGSGWTRVVAFITLRG